MKTLLFLIVGLAPLHATAAIVASYQFDDPAGTGAANANTPNSIDTHPDSTALPFGVGAGINGGAVRYSTFTASTGSRSVSMLSDETNGSDAATTIAANDYWTFTVNATTGVLNLDQLTFNYGGSNGITTTVFVRSSIDSFATTLASFGPYTVASGGGGGFTTGGVLNVATLNFASNPAYQNLSTITFNIYAFDNANSSGSAGARIDNIQLSVIPEPTSALLILALTPFTLLTRRRPS